MKNFREFPFKQARRTSLEETEAFRKAIEKKLGVKRLPRGRPPKKEEDRYRAISIRLHPRILRWARQEAKKLGIGYQSIINQVLLRVAA